VNASHNCSTRVVSAGTKSRLELRRLRDFSSFLAAALQTGRQMLGSRGRLGLSLVARIPWDDALHQLEKPDTVHDHS
jgi:hypothetical protein